MKNILKSILAIVAGIATGVTLSIGTDTILESTNIFPDFEEVNQNGFNTPWMLALALTYRSVYTVASGYVTAALAPNKPMHHAVVLGIIGIIVTIAGSIAMWELSSAWYQISLIIVTLPFTWFGGKLRTAPKLG